MQVNVVRSYYEVCQCGKARQWLMETNILAHFCFKVVLLSFLKK